MEVEIIPATLEHAQAMAPLMRQADVGEIWAAAKKTPEDALVGAVERSIKAWTGMVDGQFVCMWGVCARSVLSGVGVPWMLGTDLVEKYPRTFLRRCRPIVKEMGVGFDVLTNYVDARNELSIRWLKWLGFELDEPKPFGALQLPFHRFERRV